MLGVHPEILWESKLKDLFKKAKTSHRAAITHF